MIARQRLPSMQSQRTPRSWHWPTPTPCSSPLSSSSLHAEVSGLCLLALLLRARSHLFSACGEPTEPFGLRPTCMWPVLHVEDMGTGVQLSLRTMPVNLGSDRGHRWHFVVRVCTRRAARRPIVLLP